MASLPSGGRMRPRAGSKGQPRGHCKGGGGGGSLGPPPFTKPSRSSAACNPLAQKQLQNRRLVSPRKEEERDFGGWGRGSGVLKA